MCVIASKIFCHGYTTSHVWRDSLKILYLMLRLIKKKTCLQLHNFLKIKYITLSTFRLHLASTKPESIKVDQYPLNYIGFELVLLTLVTPSLGLEPSTIFNFFYFKIWKIVAIFMICACFIFYKVFMKDIYCIFWQARVAFV